jgi:thiol-disulfide isomerase/thioredoxin
LEGTFRRLDLPGNQLELEGTLINGTKLDWASYRGKVVLVDFWASWCEPCRMEIPNIKRNLEAYKSKGFEVIGVCIDDDRAPAEAYIKEAGVSWPSLLGAKAGETGFDHPVARKYGVTGIPLAILVDRDGKVVSLLARGPLLEIQLRELLGEPAGK